MFAEDTSAYFDTVTGFAQTCTLDGVDVPGIFDNAYAIGAVGPYGMATTEPRLALKTTNVPADVVGKSCVVDSVAYTVVAHEPDGTGISVLRLELAA